MTRVLFITFLLCIAAQAFAQNAIGLKHYSIEESKGKSGTTEGDGYLLRLKIACKLAGPETAILKITADPLEDQKYVTLAEIRVRKGKQTPVELDIPISTWKKDRLNLYILLQEKDTQPEDTPLANKSVFLERASIKSAK